MATDPCPSNAYNGVGKVAPTASKLDGACSVIHISLMNKDHETSMNPSALPPKKSCVKNSYIATAILFFIAVFLWSDRSGSKSSQLELAEQNAQLQQERAALQSELDAARLELDDFKSGAPAQNPVAEVAPVKPEAPVEEPETLLLQQPSIRQTPTGLVARLVFHPTLSEQLSLVALVVRLPGESEAKILSFKAATAFSNVKTRVDESGKFAIFQGVPGDLKALEFDLTVSAPVTATVRGSKGIKPFEIIISPDNAEVRKL